MEPYHIYFGSRLSTAQPVVSPSWPLELIRVDSTLEITMWMFRRCMLWARRLWVLRFWGGQFHPGKGSGECGAVQGVWRIRRSSEARLGETYWSGGYHRGSQRYNRCNRPRAQGEKSRVLLLIFCPSAVAKVAWYALLMMARKCFFQHGATADIDSDNCAPDFYQTYLGKCTAYTLSEANHQWCGTCPTIWFPLISKDVDLDEARCLARLGFLLCFDSNCSASVNDVMGTDLNRWIRECPSSTLGMERLLWPVLSAISHTHRWVNDLSSKCVSVISIVTCWQARILASCRIQSSWLKTWSRDVQVMHLSGICLTWGSRVVSRYGQWKKTVCCMWVDAVIGPNLILVWR